MYNLKQIDNAARLAAPAFATEGWEWVMRGRGSRVPNEAEIAETIRELIAGAAKDGGTLHGTGRLVVMWNPDFNQYEIMLEVGRITPGELWTEEGIDHFVTKERD